MHNKWLKQWGIALFIGLFSGVGLQAQVDTTTYHELYGVEVVAKKRHTVTREGAPLQVLDTAGRARPVGGSETFFRCDRAGLWWYRRAENGFGT